MNLKLKIALFLLLAAGIFLLMKLTPVGNFATVENLRSAIEPLGLWGGLLFVGIFIAGTILQVPGVIFYSASFLIFGSLLGGIIAYVGSILAVTASFYFARHIGGNVMDLVKNQRVRKLLEKLERQPVLVVGVLRSFLWVSPPLNYALAFSAIPTSKYIAGSTIGLIVPALLMAFGSKCIF